MSECAVCEYQITARLRVGQRPSALAQLASRFVRQDSKQCRHVPFVSHHARQSRLVEVVISGRLSQQVLVEPAYDVLQSFDPM
jgi:hypothetical protein